jgi:hypothetical protein
MWKHTPAFSDVKVGNGKTKGVLGEAETIPSVSPALPAVLRALGQKSHDTPPLLVDLEQTEGGADGFT